MALSTEDCKIFRGMMLSPKAQNSAYRTLADVDKFMSRNNLTYWGCGSTSLGEQRHGGLIPWDGSVNLGVMKPTFAAVAAHVSELQRLGYGVETHEGLIKVAPKYSGIGHTNTSCNIFMFRKTTELFREKPGAKTRKETIIELGVESARVRWPGARWRKTDLLPPRRAKFGPQEICVPRKPKNHLLSLYGADWKTVAAVSVAEGRTIRIPIDTAAREAEAAALAYRIIEYAEQSGRNNSPGLGSLVEQIKARVEFDAWEFDASNSANSGADPLRAIRSHASF
jgi:hypothetical protein